MNDPILGDCEWETVGHIELDSATIDFIDGGVLQDLEDGHKPVHVDNDVLVGTVAGRSFNTAEDNRYPVEVASDVSGETFAVRVVYADDIAELDAEWAEFGSLTVTTGQLMVGDLICFRTDPPVIVRCPNGEHQVQICSDGYWLGARLIVRT